MRDFSIDVFIWAVLTAICHIGSNLAHRVLMMRVIWIFELISSSVLSGTTECWSLTRSFPSVHWKSSSTVRSFSPIQALSWPRPGQKHTGTMWFFDIITGFQYMSVFHALCSLSILSFSRSFNFYAIFTPILASYCKQTNQWQTNLFSPHFVCKGLLLNLFRHLLPFLLLHVSMPHVTPTKTHTHTHTVDEVLLRSSDDAAEVGTVLSAVFLCILPGVSVGEVPVGQRGESGYENTYFIHYAGRQA